MHCPIVSPVSSRRYGMAGTTNAAMIAPPWYAIPTQRARTSAGKASVRKTGVTPAKPTPNTPPRNAPRPSRGGETPM